MTTDKIHLAVWRDCHGCQGTGRIDCLSSTRPRRRIKPPCSKCSGLGKLPTFIPLDELVNLDSGIQSLAVVRSIRNWMTGHDAEVDHLAAELDASGLVPDVPPKVSGVEDRVRAVPLEEDAADLGRMPTDQELGSGTLPQDAGKDLDLKPSATSVDIGTPAWDFAWSEHPAKQKESLELALEQIVANSSPSESMGKIDRQGNAVDDRDERLQIIFSTALDVLARLRGIGQESDLVPDAAMPALDGIFYGPEDLTKASLPEGNVTEMVRALLKRACITDTGQVEYVMDGLVPIFQLARKDAQPSPAVLSDQVVKLRQAARHLLDVLKRHHFMGSIKAGKTKLMYAVAILADALDTSPAQTSPDIVQAEGKDGVPCLRCCGTGNVLFWNGSQPCGECNGSGVKPAKEGVDDD